MSKQKNISDFNATSMGQMQESVADPDLPMGEWGAGVIQTLT